MGDASDQLTPLSIPAAPATPPVQATPAAQVLSQELAQAWADPQAQALAQPVAKLFEAFSDADEILFEARGEFVSERIAELCRAARTLAQRVQAHYRTRQPAEIARAFGVEIVRERWETAAGRICYLGECTRQPPQIRLNLAALDRLIELGKSEWGEAADAQRVWFSADRVAEVVIAHELYHLLSRHALPRAAELAAHVFARDLLALPFSPLLYETVLQNPAHWQ